MVKEHQKLHRRSMPTCKGRPACSERLVMLVEGVGNPQGDLSVAFGEADTSVQGTVEWLAGVVLLCPVDASCRPVVGIEGGSWHRG